MDNNIKNNKIAKILAWIGLIVIAILISVLAYSLFIKNGQLAFTMTFALVFISILFWIGIRVYKGLTENSTKKKEERERAEFIKLANTKTKKK